MKKYRIKDADGAEYEVEELTDEAKKEEEVVKKEVETKDSELTAEEIAALKELASLMPELKNLCEKKVEEKVKETKEVVDEEVDEKEDKKEVEEEILETKANDSKTSFGSVVKQKVVEDSITENEEIESAWAKRYGGVN